MDQNIKQHTVGHLGTDTSEMTTGLLRVGTTAASGVGGGKRAAGTGVDITGNSWILIQGYTNTTSNSFVAGDVFRIATCFAVNPMSGESTGTLRDFVVTTAALATDKTSTDSVVRVDYYPQMIETGPYATVNTIPANMSKVWVEGITQKQHPQNLVFHKNAFALVMVPLEVPDGTWSATATEDGYSCRVVKDYDIDVDSEIIRLDVLYGVKTIYPELAVRIFGAAT